MFATAEPKKEIKSMRTNALILRNGTDIDWHLFEKSLHDHFGVNAVTLDRSGARKTAENIVWANSLCALIKAHPDGAKKICNRLLEILIQAVKTKKAYAMDECAAGMNKIVFPIIQNEEVNGFINICGRPFSNTDRIYTDYIQKTIHADAEEIQKLLPTVTPIDPRTIKKMKHFVTSYAQ